MTEPEYAPIWLSTWTFQNGKGEVKISGVVVKGTNPQTILKNPLYLSRAERTLNGKMKAVSVKLDRKLGEGIKE